MTLSTMAALSKWVPIGATPDQSETNMMKPLKLTTIDKIGGIYCHICHITFGNKKDYDTHYVKHGTGSADIVYTCVACHKEITGYPSFRGHCYLNHVVKDKFKCEYCEKVFSKHCVLSSHIKAVHQFKCVTCDNEFQNQKELALHQIIHKNDQGPPYDCGTCGQQIDSTDDCEQHIEDHCSMTYSCPICDETLDDIKNAASHLTKHFGNVLTDNDPVDDEEPTVVKNDSSIDLLGGIFCSLCEQIYKARPEFDSHYVLDHPDKPIVYACNICAKEYDKYFLFANHCYDHYAKGRFQCEECYKCFPRLSLLAAHVEAAHVAGAALACGACGRGFRTARRLRDHARAAHGRAAHQCPHQHCANIFSTPRELSAHVRQHAGSAALCARCGLRFSSLGAAARHVAVHRRAAYGCPVCARRYSEKYLVMKHVNQHFSSVLHICKICGKVYNARSRLNNHMKVHNEVKDHKCTYCGKGFTKAYLLNQHINIHTGLRPYACTACTKTFASQPNLVKHMKCMHNITKIDMKLCYNPNPTTKIPNPRPNTKIEKFEAMLAPHSHEISKDESNDESHNNNTSVNVESVENFSSLEMSPEVYDAPVFDDADENGWKTDEIDPGVLEMLEKNIGNIEELNASADITELENALWVQSPTIPTAWAPPAAAAPSVPREYGPEFVNDDHLLPHIDPRLLTAPAQPHIDPRLLTAPAQPRPRAAPAQRLPAWEPPLHADQPACCVIDPDMF